MKESLTDTLNRPLRDLRISVTDRCNFRCIYCMPKQIYKDHHFLPHEEVLTFEEITHLVKLATSLGIKKVRITGGEPLMRKDLEVLIAMLADIPNLDDIAMTTNGSFPLERIVSLHEAGLQRMTVSLDSLDDEVFTAMNDVGVPVARVLAWIETSIEAEFSPVKINMVVKRGVNTGSILPMARKFDTPQTILRFVEYMDVGGSNGWRMDDVVPAKEILEMIHTETPIEPLERNYPGEVARRWRYIGSGNEIGLIASVTQPFCGDCTRARLSADGKLFTCLFSNRGHDLKSLLRGGKSDQEILDVIKAIWTQRQDRYSEIRSEETVGQPKIEMPYIGG
ncbi:MAG: GTP 3',8-cyclase MoaA [Anaerolineales bacterium]